MATSGQGQVSGNILLGQWQHRVRVGQRTKVYKNVVFRQINGSGNTVLGLGSVQKCSLQVDQQYSQYYISYNKVEILIRHVNFYMSQYFYVSPGNSLRQYRGPQKGPRLGGPRLTVLVRMMRNSIFLPRQVYFTFEKSPLNIYLRGQIIFIKRQNWQRSGTVGTRPPGGSSQLVVVLLS